MSNPLQNEKSPYLAQHASNPVCWYPWGDVAFEIARREDKPVFLSVGYSTCHWCHVMAHESFEDQEVARLLNESFVCIKVDREERPDIDHLYMTACQLMTGSGGWPLTVILTPDKKPFFAGTYFPKESIHGRMGMLELVPRLAQAWKEDRATLLKSTGKILEFLKEDHSPEKIHPQTLLATYEQLKDSFEPEYGGFSPAPKFPTPHNLIFLIRYGQPEMAEFTLQQMRRGGIFDHVGFGFHRYSTDKEWLVPHFEKMLYDQALLALAYHEAFEATKKPFYKTVVDEIFSYVFRDLTSPDGAFYCAEDADSEGEEGKFYTWTDKEIRTVMTEEELAVLNLTQNIFHISIPEMIRQKLFAYRTQRIHPSKDDKVLTDWNGLMIAALAKAGYIGEAKKAAEFIFTHLTKDGRLLHRYRDGEAGIAGQASDYAYFIWGLFELYQTSFELRYLQEAIRLSAEFKAGFWDKKNGGYFMTDEPELVRQKDSYDGAIPSANAVAYMNDLRLSAITGQKAPNTIESFAIPISRVPMAYSFWMCGLLLATKSVPQIVIVGDAPIPNDYLPGGVKIRLDASSRSYLQSLSPHYQEYTNPGIYICKDFVCEPR